jgi:hypothetical protein
LVIFELPLVLGALTSVVFGDSMAAVPAAVEQLRGPA